MQQGTFNKTKLFFVVPSLSPTHNNFYQYLVQPIVSLILHLNFLTLLCRQEHDQYYHFHNGGSCITLFKPRALESKSGVFSSGSTLPSTGILKNFIKEIQPSGHPWLDIQISRLLALIITPPTLELCKRVCQLSLDFR